MHAAYRQPSYIKPGYSAASYGENTQGDHDLQTKLGFNKTVHNVRVTYGSALPLEGLLIALRYRSFFVVEWVVARQT